jgi:hypothetical protein
MENFAERKTQITHDYNGPSMNPTLLPGDGMVVAPYGEEPIKVGDVVVFRDPNQQRNVVHRVISIDNHGIRTRGDNNNLVDPYYLQPGDIVGKLTSVIRKNRAIPIRNGLPGHLIGSVLRTRRMFLLWLFRTLHPVYRQLARSGIFRLPARWLQYQVISFQRPWGSEMYLRIWRRWNIGVYVPGRGWRLRRPFELFVNVASLPKPKTSAHSSPCKGRFS